MRNLAELQSECAARDIQVPTQDRVNREPSIAALREYPWGQNHPGEPLPAQIMPMLLSDWEDLDERETREIERDGNSWIVQPQLDGVRALLHVEPGRVRITGRKMSQVTYRLAEFQANLPHLTDNLAHLSGTILDGELVCPVSYFETHRTVTAYSWQAAVAVLAASPHKARQLQKGPNSSLQFHVFDILQFRGVDVMELPLIDRMDFLAQALREANHPDLKLVPSFMIGKAAVHRNLLAEGGEGSCWKKLSSPYLPGTRTKNWIKRKSALEVEASVSGFSTGPHRTFQQAGCCAVPSW